MSLQTDKEEAIMDTSGFDDENEYDNESKTNDAKPPSSAPLSVDPELANMDITSKTPFTLLRRSASQVRHCCFVGHFTREIITIWHKCGYY